MAPSPSSIAAHFATIGDPRREHGKLHRLEDILVLVICASICGADTFVAIEEFGKAKLAWLRRFVPLKHGIPSHDTLGAVFARIDPEAFARCFAEWVQAAFERTSGQVIPIDGKTLRRSHDRDAGRTAITMVSAWAQANHLVLAQVKVEEGSNEIRAIPRLLELLDVSGCIVTIEAIGCQQDITEAIIGQGGDYVLALKKNQAMLLEEAQQSLVKATTQRRDVAAAVSSYETEETGHGRLEHRRYSMTEQLTYPLRRVQWAGLRSFGLVECERSEGGKTSIEQRSYIASLPADAERLAEAIRGHWSIENQAHWVLDVAFSEDQSRIRKDHAGENMAVVRRLALNLLQQEKTSKVGVASKRLKAAWDEGYLAKVLQLE